MNDIKKGIQYALQTNNNMTLAMSGSGHTAMECAVFNIVEPGESVLVAINGIWGERVAEIAERMGMKLIIQIIPARWHSLEIHPYLQSMRACLLFNIFLFSQVQRFTPWLKHLEDILQMQKLNR